MCASHCSILSSLITFMEVFRSHLNAAYIKMCCRIWQEATIEGHKLYSHHAVGRRLDPWNHPDKWTNNITVRLPGAISQECVNAVIQNKLRIIKVSAHGLKKPLGSDEMLSNPRDDLAIIEADHKIFFWHFITINETRFSFRPDTKEESSEQTVKKL